MGVFWGPGGVPVLFIPPRTPPAPHRRPAPSPARCSRRSPWGSGRSGSSEPRGGGRGGRSLWGSPTAPNARSAAPHKCTPTGGGGPKGLRYTGSYGGGDKRGGRGGVPCGPIKPHRVLQGTVWPHTAPCGSVWSCMAQYGSVWFYLAPYGPMWSYMASYGSIWFCMVP